MERIVKLMTNRGPHDIRESASESMTIRDLIDLLENYPMDSKVVLAHRDYNYGYIRESSFVIEDVETYEEEQDRIRKEEEEEERLEREEEQKLENAISKVALAIGDRFEFVEDTFFVWNQFGRKVKSRLYAVENVDDELYLIHIPVGKENEDDWHHNLNEFQSKEVEKILELVINSKDVVLETEIEIYHDKDSLGLYDCECYDGFAICKNIKTSRYVSLTYPKKADIDYDTAIQILRYRGLYNVSAEDITYGDIMMYLGEIEKN